MLKAIREKLSELKKLSDEEENKSVPKVSKKKNPFDTNKRRGN